MHIPLTLLYLSILYFVFQSVLIAAGVAVGTMFVVYALVILLTKDDAKSLRYTCNVLSLLVIIVPCLAILWISTWSNVVTRINLHGI